MSVGNYFKKRVNIFVITLAVILICLIVTFIYLTKNHFNQDLLIDDSSIRVTFQNGKKGIKFGETPMSLQEGLLYSPDNIYIIENKEDRIIDYEILVNEVEQEGETIDADKVMVCVGEKNCSRVGTHENGLVYTGTLAKKHTTTVNLKFWVLKSEASESDLDKSILLNVDIKEIKK